MRNHSPKTVTATDEEAVAPLSQNSQGKSAHPGFTGSISVIIPVFGDGLHIARCLESLQSGNGRNLQVLLVDDGSPQPVAEQLELDLPGVRCCRLEINHGPSHAINHGLEETAGCWVIVLNSDVQVRPGSLTRLIDALEERPEYDFAVAKLLQDKEPFAVDSTGDGLLLGGGGYRIGHGEEDKGEGNVPRPILSAAGTASAYRRTVLEDVGGFDEDFFGFMEDLDLSLRARLRGYRGLYVPSAVVYHQGGATFEARGPKEIFRLITRNQIWVVAKDYPAAVLLRALPRIVVFQVLWMGLMLSRGLLSTCLRGFWEAFRGLPRMLRKRRHIQRSRSITPREFWEMLKYSEQEIAAWQQRLEPTKRSLLLRIYFGLFRSPTTKQQTASPVLG